MVRLPKEKVSVFIDLLFILILLLAISPNYVIADSDPPVSSVTLSASPASPRLVNTPVTFTATATGGGTNREYEFAVLDPVIGVMTVIQPYGPSNTFPYTPTNAGTYSIRVYVRNVGSAASYEAAKWLTDIVLANPPVTSVVLEASPLSPRLVNTPVTFTATATGGGTSKEYEFAVNDPTIGVMTVIQPYGPSNSFPYIPTNAGTYSIRVYVRNVGSAASYEAARWLADNVATSAPVTSVTLEASPLSPQPVNTPVTFTATATGGGPSKEYEFAVNDPAIGVMTVIQPYGPANTFFYTPTNAGAYSIRVYVRNVGSVASYEAARWYAYDMTIDTTIPHISIDPITLPVIGNTLTITGSMEDGATVSVSVDTTATVGLVSYPSSTTWSCPLSGLVAGENIISITATDAAGNTASVIVPLSVTIPATVSGRIDADTTWTLANSPYTVTSTVQVYGTTTTPVTLTIKPGVVVKFNSGAGLQIGSGANKGALIAQGSADNHITFTRSGVSGTWGTLSFQDGTVDGTTIFENVDMQYSSGITMNSTSPTIRNSTITDVRNGYYGLSLTSSNPTLNTVTIANSGPSGIYLSSSSPVITGSSLSNSYLTGGHGISGTGSPVISNCTVSIANTENKYGIYLNSGSTSSLSINNSNIANGLWIGTTNISPTITGNTFTNVDSSPLHAGANVIGQILSSNAINGMTSAGRIEVVGDNVNRDSHWTWQVAPYVVVSGTVAVYKDTTGPATLTIDPGVTVKFASGGLQVGSGTNQGALVAQGMSGNRITFTREGTTGIWGRITFYNGTIDDTTILENVNIQYNSGITMDSASPTIRNSTITNVSGDGMDLTSSNPMIDSVTITNNGTYGIHLSSSSPTITGGSLTNSNPAGHGINGSGSPVISNYAISIVNAAGKYGIYLNSASTSSLSITNSTVANGLYLGTTGITPTVTGNIFSNADNSPIHAGANVIGQIMNSNTVNGMTTAGKIEVAAEQVKQDATWKKWNAPYVVVSGTVSVYKDATTSSTLTIDPGVTVKFGSGGGFQVGSNAAKGVLVAQGTEANKILFTSNQTAPTAGYWDGISFSGAASSASRLEHVTVEYAGSGGTSTGNITLSTSSPVIRNCLIRNSSQSGIYLANSQNWPVVIDSEITGNKWGVYASSSNPYITNTKITSNTSYGVYNASTTMDVDARDNWWGVATGPTHTSNVKGTGDKINDHVLYNPWLGQTPGAALSITNAKVRPASLNPDGGYSTFIATISSSATWTVTIVDGNDVLVKTFNGTGTTINQKWYGEDSQSVKVVDGIYYYRIDAFDSTTGSSASSPQGMVMVSRQIPIAIMDPPADGQMYQCGGTVDITGTAADPTDFKNYIISYGAGDNPATWTNLWTSTTTTTNGLLHRWNTASLTGNNYTVKLTVNDDAGNVATLTSLIRFQCIQNAAISNAYLSPNGDGTKDTTTISASAVYPNNWTLTIKDSSNTAIRTYTTINTSVTLTWDGKDGTDTVVPDGIYTYQIDAASTETAFAALPVTGSVVVDTTYPAAQITAPTANAVLASIVPIIGTATDAYLEAYKVEYGPASGAGPWSLISGTTASVNNGTLATWVTNDTTNAILVANGDLLLRLSATDRAGNTSLATVPLSMDNLNIANVGVNSNTLDTSATEINTVFFTISSQATVTLSIIPEKQGPAGTPVYQTGKVCAAGACSFTWDGKNNTGKVVPDEAYLFVLAASDGTRTDTYSPAELTGTGTVTCSQSTGLNPRKNIPMTVTYTPAQPSRVSLSIVWSSQTFTILNAFPAPASITQTFDWDGRNPSNKMLDYGAKAYCTTASLLRENFIIATGDAVQITELTTDPYMIQISYGQFSRIKYTLSKDAYVTVIITSPSGTALTVVNSQFQTAGAQELDWNGIDATDTTGTKTLITEEGDYMVTVQAMNPITGTSSFSKANVRIGY